MPGPLRSGSEYQDQAPPAAAMRATKSPISWIQSRSAPAEFRLRSVAPG